MRIIPVVDLLNGDVVHAVAGNRSDYRPIKSSLVDGSDPQKIAKALVELTAAEVLYVADLGSLIDGSAPDREQIKLLSQVCNELWIDADWPSNPDGLTEILHLGNCRPIFSLETISDLAELGKLVEASGDRRPIFSIDLNNGHLVAKSDALISMSLNELVNKALQIGIRDLIVLDVAAVGTGGGAELSLAVVDQILLHQDRCHWIFGGGIRHLNDLQRLKHNGCESALIATALHDGSLSYADIRKIAEK